jgi:hypothetical protein
MVMRILEAQNWLDRWEMTGANQGRSPEEMASLLFIAAALLQREEGHWLMDICVDANRKLGCSHGDLAIALANKGQSIRLLEIQSIPG